MPNEAEKFLLTLKDHFLWSILTTSDCLRPTPRACGLKYKPEIGFFITTVSISKKVSQIEKNPIGTISIYPDKGQISAVAHCILQVTKEQKVLDAAWSDELLQFGYTGKTDERFRVILITVNSVTFGNDKYAGVPFDYKIYEKITKEDLPPLPTGPFKTKEVEEFVKSTFKPLKNAHMITFDGFVHDSRVMEIHYKDDENVGLYAITGFKSKKVQQIIANPNVSLLIENKETWEQKIFDTAAKICECPEIKKKIWDDEFKQYGFTGPEDEKLAVILFSTRRVIHHNLGSHISEVLVAEPVQYDKDLQLLNKLSKLGEPINLVTADERGVLHSRIMGVVMYNSVIGFCMVTKSTSAKNKQLEHNNHAILTSYKAESGDSYTIEAQLSIKKEKEIMIPTWIPMMAAVGYKGPEDPARSILLVNVTKADHVNVKQFWANLPKQ
ncbi:MAG: hypothetical protein EZS28_006784 [Streblomastix strix]|uniref:General stress protein FMN-binding split barrel domain-containing protein n=1 Tax=Streblomastix strix TaxID=222440 RepID=A0A5J4WU57_9EUKA|nr:MAG: hypothetical protein EZS28_006784 [Streblomastix strix]